MEFLRNYRDLCRVLGWNDQVFQSLQAAVNNLPFHFLLVGVCRVVCKRYDGGCTFDQNELSVAAGSATAGRRIVVVILHASDGNRLYLASDEERGVACTEGFGLLVEIQVRLVVILDLFGDACLKQQRFRRNGEVVDGELIRLVVVGYQHSSLLK